MVMSDYVKWQYQNADRSGLSNFFGQLQLPPARSRGLTQVELSFLNPRNARQSLLTLVEIHKHPFFRDISSFTALSDEEYEEYINSQQEMLASLLTMISDPDSQFINMWEQSYLKTESFTKIRNQYDRSQLFEGIFEQVMINPRSYSFLSDLSVRKINEYQNLSNNISAIQEKFQKEKVRRLEELPEDFWMEYKSDIIDMILSETEGNLRTLFGATSIAVDKLISYAQAKRTLAMINNKIENAQKMVNGISEQYRGEYQLFRHIIEKGAC